MNLYNFLLSVNLISLFCFLASAAGVHHIVHSHPKWYGNLKRETNLGINNILTKLSLIFFFSGVLFIISFISFLGYKIWSN